MTALGDLNIPEFMWPNVDNSPTLWLNTQHDFPAAKFDRSLGQIITLEVF